MHKINTKKIRIETDMNNDILAAREWQVKQNNYDKR